MNHSTSSTSTKTEIPSESGSNMVKKKVFVLVVDDNPVIRKIHKALLNKFDLEAHVAENGKDAVELFNSGVQFDLVLMDMEMPIMDGFETTRELRAMGVNCKIVGITSHDSNSGKHAFVGAGLDDCLEKPLNGPKVQSLLEMFEMREKA